MNSSRPPKPVITIAPGTVDQRSEHVIALIRKRGRLHQLARVAPADPERPQTGNFVVEWIATGQDPQHGAWQKEVEASLRFLLIDLKESQPWAYLCYHTITTSNFYAAENGSVHWIKEPGGAGA